MALNVRYLQDADQLLAAGDYPQASEKYWGAAAEIVKAVAAMRGWKHSSHRELINAVNLIAGEMDQPEIIQRQFKVAGILHGNFYENFMMPDQVASHSEDVKKFISTMRNIAGQDGYP